MEKNTLLLVGGDLCERAAKRLDPAHWRCIGLRRRAMPATHDSIVSWHKADLLRPESLSFLADDELSNITHVLYAPAPDGRTEAHYSGVYAQGLSRMLASLAPGCLKRLQRCVLVGSSAVWGPSDGWVCEETPVHNTGFRAAALLEAEATLGVLAAPHVGVTLRLSGLYGPGRVRLLEGLRAGAIVAPNGPGHWVNRIHIEDAAQACAHLLKMEAPEALYIGTDDYPTPTAQLYDALAEMMAVPLPARRAQPPSGKRLLNARLRASGWVPQWPNALEWYREHWAGLG